MLWANYIEDKCALIVQSCLMDGELERVYCSVALLDNNHNLKKKKMCCKQHESLICILISKQPK